MYKDEYISALRKVSASPELRARLEQSMRAPQPRTPVRFPRRVLAGTLAAAAAVMLVLPVWLDRGSKGGAGLDAADVNSASAACATEQAAADAASPADAPEESDLNGAAPRVYASVAESLPSEFSADGNPTLDLPESELPAALPSLACASDADAQRAGAQALADALGLKLTNYAFSGETLRGEGTAVSDALTLAVSTDALGSSAVVTETESGAPPALDSLRDALTELSLSLAPSGSATVELLSDEMHGPHCLIASVVPGDAREQLLSYTASRIFAAVDETGAVTSLRVGHPLTEQADETALRPLDEARAEAQRELPDGYEILHYALCYRGDHDNSVLSPFFVFYAFDETGADVVPLFVSAWEES